MTLKELSNQLFDLSVGGYFNHEKYTKTRLLREISSLMKGDDTKTGVMEVALPDGQWHFKVRKLPQFGRGYYEYEIPETREQEKVILKGLMVNS